MSRVPTATVVAATAAILVGVAGCSNVPRVITEYRIDVQQGNVLTQEMVAQLRPGLTKDQVRYVLGSPVLVDIFHANRWDYVYRLQRGIGTQPVSRQFAVFFNDAGLLDRVEGDLEVAVPGELEIPVNRTRVLDLGTQPENGATEPGGQSVVAPENKGWWARAKESVGF